jgi:hypothetical protein
MPPYDNSKDEILWESAATDFKPKAIIKAVIKRYNGGTPKLLLVEEGIGHHTKNYTGAVLKRLEIERIDTIIDLLIKGREELKKVLLLDASKGDIGDAV